MVKIYTSMQLELVGRAIQTHNYGKKKSHAIGKWWKTGIAVERWVKQIGERHTDLRRLKVGEVKIENIA